MAPPAPCPLCSAGPPDAPACPACGATPPPAEPAGGPLLPLEVLAARLERSAPFGFLDLDEEEPA